MRPLHFWALGLVWLANLAVVLAQQPPLQFRSVPLRLAACQPVQWDWTGGTPPYSMFYQVTSEVNNTAIKMIFTGVYATTFTWPEVMLEPDLRVTIMLLDGTYSWTAGTNDTNSKMYETVVFGNDRSCLDRVEEVARPPFDPSLTAAISTLPTPSSAESSSVPLPGSSGVAAENPPVPSEAESDSAATSSEAPEAAPAKKKSNAGAIAGGVVGGSFGIAIIAAAVLIWLRRQRIDKLRPSSPFDIGVGEGSYPEPTPFEPPQTSQVPLATPLPTTTTTSPATSPTPFAMPAFTEKQRFTSAIPPPVRSLSASSSEWASSSNIPQTLSERTSDVFTRPSTATNNWATTSETGTDHAADAGRLPTSPELPPMYNPAWRESDEPRE